MNLQTDDQNNTDSQIVVLEAFEHVYIDQVETYEQMGKAIDNKVKETEPGMLVHALTKVSENQQEVVYRWLEVFDGTSALEAHLCNPIVISHIDTMNNGILSGPTDILIYANLSTTKKELWRKKFAGANLTFASMITSFFAPR